MLDYRHTAMVKLAHARCAETQVIVLDADEPDSLASVGLGDMLSTTAVVE